MGSADLAFILRICNYNSCFFCNILKICFLFFFFCRFFLQLSGNCHHLLLNYLTWMSSSPQKKSELHRSLINVSPAFLLITGVKITMSFGKRLHKSSVQCETYERGTFLAECDLCLWLPEHCF